MHKFLLLSLLVIVLTSKASIGQETTPMNLAQQLAQKIMLDLRYYCPERQGTSNQNNILEGYQQDKNKERHELCKKPLTQLPPELADLIRTSDLGGVILFADNLVDVEPIIQLTSDLQNAALSSKTGLPLFISIDQEGGRVVRLPRTIATSFSGNMAIGATVKNKSTQYARAVGKAIATELKVLGFNVNYAPTVDVNVNPNNPVINVRSFGENPQSVAELGIAMLEGMQSQGVIATLKHFPGHGDTNTDSHTGLPVVNHDLTTVEKVDLYPFAQAIKHSHVDMIMTAHIQYPALDDSLIINKHGKKMIKPATLSKKILTELLREKMDYQGLILTDALDMAGISHFFTPIEAVLNTFKAGADIAVMPIKIRQPEDIKRFKYFLTLLQKRIKEEPYIIDTINKSVQRIVKIKKKINALKLDSKDIHRKVSQAKAILANKDHQALEQALALDSIVVVQNKFSTSLPFNKITNIVIAFPEKLSAQALALSLSKVLDNKSIHFFTTTLDEYLSLLKINSPLIQSDLTIIASDDKDSAVELGGVDDLNTSINASTKYHSQANKTLNSALYILMKARQAQQKTVFISLKSPYQLAQAKEHADMVLASFNGNAYLDEKTGEAKGAVFDALALIITLQQVATATLPVTIE